MNNQTLVIVFAGIIALAGGAFIQNLSKPKLEQAQQSASPSLLINLPDLAGKQRDISEWQGKIRIINFWATWCPPCLKEIPEFINIQNEFKDKNLQFIGIAIDEKEAVVQYLKTININYPILIAGDAGISLSQQLGNIVNAVPFTVFINQQGQIIHRHPGELHRQKLLKIINQIL